MEETERPSLTNVKFEKKGQQDRQERERVRERGAQEYFYIPLGKLSSAAGEVSRLKHSH